MLVDYHLGDSVPESSSYLSKKDWPRYTQTFVPMLLVKQDLSTIDQMIQKTTLIERRSIGRSRFSWPPNTFQKCHCPA